MKKEAKGHKKGKHGSWHHIICRSIGGPDIPQNKYHWVYDKHNAYHQLFHNYLPSKAIEKINLWTDEDGKLMPQKLGLSRMSAWRKTFPGGSPAQAIKFIQKEFLPVERKFLEGKLGGDNHG